MALKVIGAGLGRTGTLSLKLALEHLGFGPCHHMAEVFANIGSQVPKWVDVVNGKPDWDSVFDGFQAAVDYPGCSYWQELADKYPDAKIILSLRDPESWFNSVNSTIFSDRMLMMVLQEGPIRTFFQGAVVRDFGDRIADKDFMVDYFKRRNDAVIAAVPRERLLVFEAKEGWEPLCAFLGVPVPDAPYPRVNSREEMLGTHEGQPTGLAAAARDAPAGEMPTPEMIAAMARNRLDTMREQAFGATA